MVNKAVGFLFLLHFNVSSGPLSNFETFVYFALLNAILIIRAGANNGEVDADRGSKEEATGESRMECGPCKRKNCKVIAEQFCIDCDENLCGSCKDVHEVLRPTQGHNLVPNNDGKKSNDCVWHKILHFIVTFIKN